MVRFTSALVAGLVLLGPVGAGKYNKKISVGDTAPMFSNLPGTDGKNYSLSDFKDKDAVVIAVTCNDCPVAQSYEDRLIAFAKKYADKKVALVAISVSRDEADRLPKMKERAQKKGFTFPYLYDESQQTGRALGASVTPQIYLLDKSRKIVYMGVVDDDQRENKVKTKYLEGALEALLKGDKIAVPETRPSGCSIVYEAKK
jgi:peroxiredoxin